MLLTTFPPTCILIEWNEEQQAFNINPVQKGKAEIRANSNGFLVVHICESRNEAHLITAFIEKSVGRNRITGKSLPAMKIKSNISALLKFSNAYQKIKQSSKKTNKSKR